MTGKKPWFSAAIVATLALGMGVNTTVFSLVNAVLYKPLPFPGGDRLVMVSAANVSANRDTVSVSYAEFRDLRHSSTSFEHLEAFSGFAATLGERGNPPDRFRGMRITPGMFDMLRTHPIVGRGFVAADEQPGAVQVVLIGYGVWKDRYAKDPGVIGRDVRLNEKRAVIVGVMPEGFKFPNNEDLWTAIIPDSAEKRNIRDYRMIGILKEHRSISEARADVGLIYKRLEKDYPDTNKDYSASIQTFHQAMNGGPIRLVFLLMLGAVAFVLLIACANVANMLLSRAMERTREVSIRTAMGASRWRIVRQLLIECLLLSAMGGALGLVLAQFGTAAFGRAVLDVGKPYWIDFSTNYVVFGYFAGLTLVTGILFGLAPALAASRVNLNNALKEGSRSSGGRRGGYMSGALVVLQFTLATVLLSAAGLLMRSFLMAQNEYSGIGASKILAARVNLPRSRYTKPEDRQQFYDGLLPRLAALPETQSVAIVSATPGEGSFGWRFEIAGNSTPESRRPAVAGVVASKGYLRLLGISMLRGRDFEDADGLPGKETVIVSQTLAARFFPRQDPIGQQMRTFDNEDKPRPWMTIIGVMPDVQQESGPNRSNDPVILVPYRFESNANMAVLLRTQGSPSALTAGLRNEVQQLDQDLPLFDTMTLAERFSRQRWYLSVFGTVFLIFALVAMGMAAVGIYAVMANAASRRTREIGVRMALGADVGAILTLVLRRGLVQLGLGMALGLAAALAVCRLMRIMLYSVSPNDPITFVSVAVALGVIGLAAIFFPARRASRLDPVNALRYE